MQCADCQAAATGGASLYGYGRIISGGGHGLAAVWASPTNYDATLHRRYIPMSGMGDIQLGTSGWALSDLASLGLVVIAAMAVWKEVRKR